MPQYTFTRYEDEITSVVEDISQDRYGRLWLASWSGLYRYDGKSFENFDTSQLNQINQISATNRFDQVVADLHDGIWIRSNDMKLYYFDSTQEKLQLASNDNIVMIYPSDGSELFFINEEGSILRNQYSKGDNINLEFYRALEENERLNGITKDKIGNIWLYTSLGLYKNNELVNKIVVNCSYMEGDAAYFGCNEGIILKYTQEDTETINSHFEQDIKLIAPAGPDKNDGLLIGSKEAGIFLFKHYERSLEKIDYPKGNDENQLRLIRNSKGLIWIYTQEGALSFYDKDKKQLVPFYNSEKQGNWDAEVFINSAFIDMQDNLWISGSWKGIEKASLRKDDFMLERVRDGKAKPEERSVRAVFEDSEGRIIASTKDGKVHLLSPKFKELQSWQHPYPVYDITSDENGTIWLASKDGGIYEGLGSRSINYLPGLDYYDPIGLKVYHLRGDNKGRLWIASFDESVSFIDLGESPRKFYSKKNKISFPTNYQNRVRFIGFSPDGEMYLCGWLGLFVCKNPYDEAENLRFEHIKDTEWTDIQHILFSKSGEIYASSSGRGLLRISKKGTDYSIRKYTSENGLLSDFLFSAIEDNDGNIWIAGAEGLNKFIPQSGNIISFPEERLGFSLSFNEGEPIMTKEGRILFNTNEGILHFSPDEISRSQFQPEIYISSCEVNGNRRRIDEKNRIRIRRDEKLDISFNAIDMSNPGGVLYAYKLNNQDWVPLGTESSISLNKIRAGKHTLIIDSTNSEGYEANNAFTLQIIASPSLWAWAIVTAVLLIIIAFILAITLRRKQSNAEDENEQEKSPEQVFIELFQKHIKDNIDNSEWNIDEISVSEFQMSRAVFYNKVKLLLGRAPAEYMREARLKKAAELLKSKEHSIAQIAYMTGFNDPHYFSTSFKAEFGMSPSQYRKKTLLED